LRLATVSTSENFPSTYFVYKARDRSVVLLPEGWLSLNDYGWQTLFLPASAS
jgi:hypothetical protein